MPYKITGRNVLGGVISTGASTAKEAMKDARQWADDGVTGITITNPAGESYDMDRFGMVLSTKEWEAD